MASWKLIVKNYGKIETAEIEVAPLTLFVGDNNSGKSYLMSLLWGIQKYGIEELISNPLIYTQEMEQLIEWIRNQIRVSLNKKEHKVSFRDISEVLIKFINNEISLNKNKLLKNIFNSDKTNIETLRLEIYNLENAEICFEYSDYRQEIIISDGKKMGLIIHVDTFDRLEKDTSFQRELITEICCIALDLFPENRYLIDNNIYLPAARTGFMLTKDIINKVGRKNTFNLAANREPLTPFINPINQFLDIIGDLCVEQKGNISHRQIAEDIENEITNGKIEISTMPNKEVQYVPDGSEINIPLRLSSAVVTELSPIVLILKHHHEIRRFFYEEPEMCLHPQLQSKIGKMIGRMVNSKIYMIVTTHSDIILQHINNMIKLGKKSDCQEICKQLGYTELDILKSDQVKIYQLKVNSKGKTEVEELACGEDGFIVPTFNDALEKIMNDAYEIQGN